MVLAFWLSFIFVDGLFSPAQQSAPTATPAVQETVTSDTVNPDSLAGQLEMHDATLLDTHSAASLATTKPQGSGTMIDMQDLSQRQSSLQDIRVLESIYEKTSDSKVLVSLIQRLATNYQFVDANKYLQLLMKQPGYEKMLDVNVVLYVLLHADTIALQDGKSLDTLVPLITQYRAEGLMTKDDETFYQGLFAVWKQQYGAANNYWANLTTPRYITVAQAFRKAIAEYSGFKNVPAYYQDALVSLTMLKNGYFSIAKRLSLYAVMQNPDYVLPYQVLAYSNFLSNNRDVAAEYFLKLASFDKTNSDNYLFLVGVSYYRQADYEQSLLYLNQVTDPQLQTDVYRYELLSYVSMNDMDNAVRIWQKLLGQQDLQATDFQLFFNIFYYQPYVNGQPFTLVHDNGQLATFYRDACARTLSGSNAVCVYGEVGQALSTSTWAGLADKLLYLSSVYHQAPILHVLGDYYFQHKEYDLAKQSYTQALSLAPSSNEQILLKTNLQKALDAK
ncbi:MAG: tetratricopeptide repeat protein [candidate division SR1 bacterium]|nr:tetratricopeptide repeat protein [candidate division SR1 bacterium]